MEIAQAQADVRRTYSGGWGGPAVSALIWLAAGVTADLFGTSAGAAVLFLAGAALIFPVNLALNRLVSGEVDLPAGHPMRGLAMQTAATMAVMLLALWMVSSVVPGAFFPLAMVAVGAHYLPFSHLYGEPAFLVAGAVQCVAGLLVLVSETSDVFGAYVMAGLLALTSVTLVLRHRRRVRGPRGERLART
ncbi:DUF7010 family protein [Ornithinimicrobium sediminis]|uniref:DUF7010 family protein n=1 Tax=Ornithinimicrobium sediminis TaxID=2904603 RepID=UPI001E43C0E3|nr:hypothetical protein [Ornithinimicrobium sediminis]MCE0486561.1 hypothetical protein [Ornithinimicrobium sediminis]